MGYTYGDIAVFEQRGVIKKEKSLSSLNLYGLGDFLAVPPAVRNFFLPYLFWQFFFRGRIK